MKNDLSLIVVFCCCGPLLGCSGDGLSTGTDTRVICPADGAGAGTDCEPCVPECKPGECGLDGCGGYCDPCAHQIARTDGYCEWDEDELPEDWPRSTFCDESTRQCKVLSAQCEDGWCFVPPGSFMRGPRKAYLETWLNSGEVGVLERPTVLTRGYYVSRTEVTQGQWMEVMETNVNPSPFPGCGEDCPVSGITGFDAMEFANRLSQREGLAPCYELVDCDDVGDSQYGRDCEEARFSGPDCPGYRLPCEAESELAFGGAADSLVRWCIGRQAVSRGSGDVDYPGCLFVSAEDEYQAGGIPDNGDRCLGPHPVGQKAPNILGLYDGIGNVYELTGTLGNVGGVNPAEKATHSRFRIVDPGYDEVIPGRVAYSDDQLVAGGGGWFMEFYPSFVRYLPAKSPEFGFRLVRTASE